MPNPNPSPPTRFERGNKARLKADRNQVRSTPIRVSKRDIEYFEQFGLPRVTAALEALHTGEAIYMLISPEYASEIDEVIAHLEATIEKNKYEWHPTHTENTMRGLVAALRIAKGKK